MENKSFFLSIVYLIMGVFLLSLFVSLLIPYLYPPQQTASVIYDYRRQPYDYGSGFHHYPRWGGGLPGMKSPKPPPAQPPPQQPSPQQAPPQQAPPQQAPPQQPSPPAQP
jgi:hypothetical protein